jgi:hypothetical protein
VIPVINGNVTFRGIVTGQDAIYDSTDSRIITADSAVIPVADIDSLVGDVKVGGNALINGGITAKNSISISGGASETVSEGAFLTLQSPSTSDYSIIQQITDGIGFYTYTSPGWNLRMILREAGDLNVAGTVAAPSLQLGTGDLLSVYDTGSFACSLFDNATYRAVVTARYTIIGNVVNLSIPSVTGTMSGVTTTFLGTIPTVIRPNRSALIGTTVILNNGALESGRIMYVTGTPERFRIYKLSSSSLDAGDGGINDGFTGNYKFSYTLD